MNKTLEGVKFTVYATQDTVESDSFNNQYDENGTYPVVNVTELKEALTNGGIDTGVNGGYGINVRKGAAVTINDGTITAAVLLCRFRRVRWSSMAAPLPVSHSAICMAATS